MMIAVLKTPEGEKTLLIGFGDNDLASLLDGETLTVTTDRDFPDHPSTEGLEGWTIALIAGKKLEEFVQKAQEEVPEREWKPE